MPWQLAIALGLLTLAALAVLAVELRRHFCRHRDLVRFWFKSHRFLIRCKRCGRVVATGRDKKHRYPRAA